MIKVVTIFIALLLATSAYAQKEDGKELFDEASCLQCHNTEDFKDKDTRKAKTFMQMKDKVFACQIANDAHWFDDDVHDVSLYLNHEYYHFKKKEE